MNNEEYQRCLEELFIYVENINSAKLNGQESIVFDILDYPEIVEWVMECLKTIGLIISDISQYNNPNENCKKNQKIGTIFKVSWGTNYDLIGFKQS